MKRKLFCELSPFCYRISQMKKISFRKLSDFFGGVKFAQKKSDSKLSVTIYKHSSLIRRTLGTVDMELQENKAHNLSIAVPKVSGVIRRPGETFSFWKLVGSVTYKKGYKDGLTISNGDTKAGVGGGMCQFTNLIHWMVLHTPLEITEHHHHDGFDLFPDFNRQIPFGTGTSIAYNYVDYRFKNNTNHIFQLIVYLTDTHLCGEMLCDATLDDSYHISVKNEHFVRIGDDVFRKGEIYRSCIDKNTGKILSNELIRNNHAKVMYDTKNLVIQEDIPRV